MAQPGTSENGPLWKPLWRAELPPRVILREFLEIPDYPTKNPHDSRAESGSGKMW